MGKIDDAVRKEVARIADGWVPIGDPSRNAALIMIAALFAGPDVGAVAEITGCSFELVSVIADRLRASGLWVDGGTDYANWFASDNLGIANFALDIDTAEGIFVRTGAKENGQFAYRLVSDDMKLYE